MKVYKTNEHKRGISQRVGDEVHIWNIKVKDKDTAVRSNIPYKNAEEKKENRLLSLHRYMRFICLSYRLQHHLQINLI